MSPVPDDIKVTVFDVTPAVQAVVNPVSTISVVTEPPEIVIVGAANLGPQGPEGPPGGTMVSAWWDYAASTNPPPQAGQIRTAPDPVVLNQPMTIYLSATDDTGVSWGAGVVNPGDDIVLQGTTGATQRCEVTSFEITAPGPTGYATIQGIATSVQGQIAKNAKVRVSIVRGPLMLGPFREGHTFAILGDLSAIELPAFFVPKAPNQTVEAIGAWGVIVSGGSIDVQFILNEVDAGPVITLTTAQQFFQFTNRVLADGDRIAARLSNPVGSPKTLTCTIVLEWSVP